jgi:hypothetical protein
VKESEGTKNINNEDEKEGIRTEIFFDADEYN